MFEILKYLACMSVVIIMVCSLSFCEKPTVKPRGPIAQEEKIQAPAPKPDTKADPEGFSGMF